MEPATRVLYGIAAVLLLLGVTLRIAPAPAGAVSRAGVETGASEAYRPHSPGEVPEAAAVIVQGNLFSPSRSAPRTRFTPPDLLAADVQAPKPRGGAATRLRLFGTVVGPSGTAALIDADPAVRGAEIYQVGDTVDSRRIVAVSESTVVLEGSSGRLVLRLQPAKLPTR